MNVSFACPRCSHGVRQDVDESCSALTCPDCGMQLPIPAGAVHEGRLTRCLVCPSAELFVRKDFPQRLGVTLVLLGFAASSVAWYLHELYWTFGILFATAFVDVVLYLVVRDALACYRCGAMHRGVRGLDAHSPFDLETHERYRQRAARTGPNAARRPGRPQSSSSVAEEVGS